MVTSDIKKFPHHIDRMELDKQHQNPPKSFKEQSRIYNSMPPSYQRLLQKPRREIVDLEIEIFELEEKVKSRKLQIQRLEEENK